MRAQFRQWRRLIYQLKRQFGQAATICRTSSDTTDLVTGIQSNTLRSIPIARVVLLTQNAIRSFAYDLSFIAANKNFTYGGFFDHTTKVVLVSARDVPDDFLIDENVYFIVAGKRAQVKKFALYDDREIYAFLVDGLTNALPLSQTDVAISDDLSMGQNASAS